MLLGYGVPPNPTYADDMISQLIINQVEIRASKAYYGEAGANLHYTSSPLVHHLLLLLDVHNDAVS